MAEIVKLGARTDGKTITCPGCHSEIKYYPEDVVPYHLYEGTMGGAPDISETKAHVVCPNKKCKTRIYV